MERPSIRVLRGQGMNKFYKGLIKDTILAIISFAMLYEMLCLYPHLP